MDQFGIHILFKQNLDGSIIIGDSHEYYSIENEKFEPNTTNLKIQSLILEEAQKILNLNNWTISKSWIGLYSQCENNDINLFNISNKITIVNAIGGKGMTAALGWSKMHCNQILNF